jgi:hypothetical protein
LRGFAGFLVFAGFVSAILHFTSVQLRILIWSEPLQPALGIILGVVGCVILAIFAQVDKSKKAAAQPAGAYPPPPGYAPQQPGYQPQQVGYPPAPGFQPGYQQPLQQFGGQPAMQMPPQGQYPPAPQPYGQQPPTPQPYGQPAQYPPPQGPYGPPQNFGPQR